TDEEDEGDAQSVRVRVVNAADSASDQFYVSWSGEPAKGRPEEVGVYVPAGQSRVVRLARPSGQSADRVVLRGDDHEFDNTYYIAPPVLQPASVLYVGSDSPTTQRASCIT